MKKLFALVLALCLLCGCTAMAETATNEITWEQVVPAIEAGNVTGDFYTFDEIAVAIWIPTGMVPTQVPDDNYIGYFVPEDGSEGAVAVCYVNMNGADLDAYKAAAEQAGASNAEMGTVNGLPCVSYEVPEQKTVCIAFTTEAGYVLEVAIAPVASDEEKIAASVIMASIQPVEAE